MTFLGFRERLIAYGQFIENVLGTNHAHANKSGSPFEGDRSFCVAKRFCKYPIRELQFPGCMDTRVNF